MRSRVSATVLVVTVAATSFTLMAAPSFAKTSSAKVGPVFKVSDPAIGADGLLPAANTCDGASLSPVLSFVGIPKGTKSVTVIMHGNPGPARPGETEPSTHVYWTLYNLPASTKAVAQGTAGGGTLGHNFKEDTLAYTPPCSQGPGLKDYTITAYALSNRLSIAASSATRDSLIQAMKNSTLATSVLNIHYARP